MSGKETQIEIAKRWLAYADGDLHTAKALLIRDDLPPRNACLLAQQSAEKSLKGLMIWLDIEVPRIHDLAVLLRKLPREMHTAERIADLTWLTEWIIEARYPGDWPEATVQDAQRAVTIANKIHSMVLEYIERGSTA